MISFGFPEKGPENEHPKGVKPRVKMRKIVSLLLAMALVLGCASAFADVNSVTVIDPEANRNIQIQKAGENEVPTGYSPTTGRKLADVYAEFFGDESDYAGENDGWDGMAVTGQYFPMMSTHTGVNGATGYGAPFYGKTIDIIYEQPKYEPGVTRMVLLYNDVLPTIGGASRSLRVGHLFIRQEWNAPLFFMGGQETDGSNKYHTDINYWINQFKLNPSWNNDKSDPASRILFDGTNGGKGFLAYKYRFQKYSDSYNVVWDFASLKREYLSGTRDAADHPHALKFGERTVEGDDAETVYVYFNNTQVYGAHDSSEGTTYINSLYSYDEVKGVYFRYMITDLNNPENNYIPFTEQRIPTPVDAGPLTGGSSTAAGVALKGDVVITDEEDGAITFANIIVQHIGMRWMGDAAPYPELTGSGNADFFIGGKHYAGVWNRDSLDDRTVFYGEDGQEIALNPGRTIIVQLPSFSASFNADLTRNDKCVLKYE